jgi:non-heme chloroperoxidase
LPTLCRTSENGACVELYFEDHGAGPPVLLVHGFPLSHTSWERQELALLEAGYRVVSYDRRGFGQSGRPSGGYDYDTLAADLRTLVEHLDLTGMTLVGACMGTGEVARYLATYGADRVRAAAMLGALPPFLLRTEDNLDGVERVVFDGMEAAIRHDRFAFLESFLIDLYNMDVLGGSRVSDQAWHTSFAVGAAASAIATRACVQAWLTDFRPDLPAVDVPTLVLHGTDDRITPIAASAARLPALIPHATFVPVEGGPHHIAWTHSDEVNDALLTFLGT